MRWPSSQYLFDVFGDVLGNERKSFWGKKYSESASYQIVDQA